MEYLISKDYSPETPYYFYKTTNLITGKFYYGTGTNKSGYLGSGTLLIKAIKRYGRENFKQEKLRFFKERIIAYQFEERFLKLIDAKNIEECYNLKNSGRGSSDVVTVIDKEGNTLSVSIDDPRYISGELVGHTKGKVAVKDKDGNNTLIDVTDPRYINGEFEHINENKVVVKDKNGNSMRVDINDPRYLSGELKHILTGTVTVKDKEGNVFKVDKDDPRYLSGELVGHTKGMVMTKDCNGNKFYISNDDPRYISGELVHVNKGVKLNTWGWKKKVTIDNITKYAYEWGKMFKVTSAKLKEYLESNNINYKL